MSLYPSIAPINYQKETGYFLAISLLFSLHGDGQICYVRAMDPITATSTLTDTRAVVLVTLSSGNVAMVDYSISVGDLMIATLLLILVVFQAAQIWRARRW